MRAMPGPYQNDCGRRIGNADGRVSEPVLRQHARKADFAVGTTPAENGSPRQVCPTEMPPNSGACPLGRTGRTSERSLPGSGIRRNTMACMTLTTSNPKRQSFARCEHPVELAFASRCSPGGQLQARHPVDTVASSTPKTAVSFWSKVQTRLRDARSRSTLFGKR